MFFNDIYGQEAVKERLIRGAKEGRVSHAWLFLGPEGCGHHPMAFAYARYLLCSDPGETDACKTCPSCRQVNQLAHPDLHFIYPVILSPQNRSAGDAVALFRKAMLQQPYMSLESWYQTLGEEKKQGVISVRDSDEVVKKLRLKSFGGGYKVMIIWRPEMLNLAAGNKLLKIIEEPPSKTVFILVGEQPEHILATIRSRTQTVRFQALSEEVVAQALETTTQVGSEEARTIARCSEGNMHLALQRARQGNKEPEHFLRFREWMRICFKKDVKGAIRWVDEIAGMGREKQKLLLVYGMQIFRECMIGNYTGEAHMRISGSELDFSKGFARFIRSSNLIPLTEAFNDAAYHIERNANPRILFLDLSFKVFRLLHQ